MLRCWEIGNRRSVRAIIIGGVGGTDGVRVVGAVRGGAASVVRIKVGVIVIVVRRIEEIEVLAVAVGEGKTNLGVGTTSEAMDPIADFSWHRQLGPVSAVEALSRHEAVKIVAALLVPSWPQSECTDGPWRHSVVMFFMCLGVLAIFDTAMFSVVNAKSSDESARA
jgi:hypothetical protein